uniref:Uncharacterized protein n=1 Tax=Solanum lycopersicum TaxID=4081 RepID=K4C0P2_SOLLC
MWHIMCIRLVVKLFYLFYCLNFLIAMNT